MSTPTHTHDFTLRHYYDAAVARVAAQHGPVRTELTALGITRVTADYDGGGDSGQLESVHLYQGTEERTESIDPELVTRVEQLLYDLLEVRHGGWENNEGAFGEFQWDVVSDALTHEHNARFTDYDVSTHRGFGR